MINWHHTTWTGLICSVFISEIPQVLTVPMKERLTTENSVYDPETSIIVVLLTLDKILDV